MTGSLTAKTVAQALLVLGEMALDDAYGYSIAERAGRFTYHLKIENWPIWIQLTTDAAGAAQLDAAIEQNRQTLGVAAAAARAAKEAYDCAEQRLLNERLESYNKAAAEHGVRPHQLPESVALAIDRTWSAGMQPYLNAWQDETRRAWPGAHTDDGSNMLWSGYVKSLADRGWAKLGLPDARPSTSLTA